MHYNKILFIFCMLVIWIHVIISHFDIHPYNNNLVLPTMFLQAIKLRNKWFLFFITKSANVTPNRGHLAIKAHHHFNPR
jgi:hypothetical protein